MVYSLKGDGRSKFEDDKHTLLAGGSNSGIMRYICSPSIAIIRLQAVYTQRVIYFARDGLSWRTSSETIYRLFPNYLNPPLPVWPWGDTHT
jgi:hypothetical protein